MHLYNTSRWAACRPPRKATGACSAA